jgi:MoxR-like ATPase
VVSTVPASVATGSTPRLASCGSPDEVHTVGSPSQLAGLLSQTGYLADGGLATVGYLALAMHRPLLLEGEPGTGKTALAEALAEALGLRLIRLQCHEGIDASQALYDWDFARQILHLRTVEATRLTQAAGSEGLDQPAVDVAEVEKSLFDERFLLARPILQALRESPVVLLIDEIDRADDEFEAFLLEVLSTFAVTIPEYGTVTAATPPIVVLTSNRTREVHDALKRRCLYHWIDHPVLAREIEIVRRRLPDVPPLLASQVARATSRLRSRDDLVKPPGVAETLDWARALQTLGQSELDLGTAASTLGAVLKYREDTQRVLASLETILA